MVHCRCIQAAPHIKCNTDARQGKCTAFVSYAQCGWHTVAHQCERNRESTPAGWLACWLLAEKHWGVLHNLLAITLEDGQNFWLSTAKQARGWMQMRYIAQTACSCAGEERRAGRISEHTASVCFGPVLSVTVYDRATVGDVTFTCTRLESNKLARDSVVLIRHNGQLRVGKVTQFLSHAAPGTHAMPDDETNIANVQWYGHASAVLEAQTMASLGCPVVKSTFEENLSGNMWPVEKLLPCKLAAVVHSSQPDHLVILSRFASFLQHIPQN